MKISRKASLKEKNMDLFDIFVFDVLLASLHLYSDISLAYTYFDTNNPWWAGVTLFAIALPGILGRWHVLHIDAKYQISYLTLSITLKS